MTTRYKKKKKNLLTCALSKRKGQTLHISWPLLQLHSLQGNEEIA